MRKLSLVAFKRAESFIMNNGRELEKARFNYLFNSGSSDEVIEELSIYQNGDGGFGHGLESDLLLPKSSPIASTIAFQILEEIKSVEIAAAQHLIKKGIGYFTSTLNAERNGWFAVSKEVNNYPHAPWWNFDPKIKMTVIDYSWGNPSAEIIGYLYKYQEYVSGIDVESLCETALANLLSMQEFNSEHEIYCYLRMFKQFPAEKRELMKEKLTAAVQALVCTKPEDWSGYRPQPVYFVDTPEGCMFGITKPELTINLDYIIDLLETDGVIYPNWQWGQYEDVWPKAKDNWAGVLTLESLKVLYNFGRI